MNTKKETKLYSFTEIFEEEFVKHADKCNSEISVENYKRKKYDKLKELFYSLAIDEDSFKEKGTYLFTTHFCKYFNKLLFAERRSKKYNSKYKNFIKCNFDLIPLDDLQEIEKIIEENMNAINKSKDLIELQITNYKL